MNNTEHKNCSTDCAACWEENGVQPHYIDECPEEQYVPEYGVGHCDYCPEEKQVRQKVKVRKMMDHHDVWVLSICADCDKEIYGE